jgi:hypothetical protein
MHTLSACIFPIVFLERFSLIPYKIISILLSHSLTQNTYIRLQNDCQEGYGLLLPTVGIALHYITLPLHDIALHDAYKLVSLYRRSV